MCVYVLIAIVRKELGVTHSLATTLPILSVSVFEKAPLHQLLAHNELADFQLAIPNRLVFNGL